MQSALIYAAGMAKGSNDLAVERYYIREHMNRLGRKAGEVAKEVGMNEGYMSELCNNEKLTLSFDLAAKIADELGISMDALRTPPDPEIDALGAAMRALSEARRVGSKKR